MAKKKQMKSKSNGSKKRATQSKKAIKAKAKKATSKSSSKKMGGSKKSTSAKKKSDANRRKFRRYVTRNLWITELAGDYKFVVPAANISEGGIFLTSRLSNQKTTSQLTIPMGDASPLQITAKPVHDRLSKDSCGTGYEFTGVSTAQLKALRGLLRNLD